MAIDFPNSPSVGDTYTVNTRIYEWDGTAWALYDTTYDADILYVDTSNNRVGVNNTSPTVALDVTGDLNVSGTITGVEDPYPVMFMLMGA
jgi:hypothetical protein